MASELNLRHAALGAALALACTTSGAGTITTIGNYPVDRGLGHTVSALPGGRVFVYGHAPYLGKFVFDPRQRTNDANPVLPAEWDPAQHAWRNLPAAPECAGEPWLHTATVLADGRVLIAGGLCDQFRKQGDATPAPYRALSLWNDKQQRWEAAGNLNTGRLYHSATLLADGSVLLAGGHADRREGDKGQPVLASVERWANGISTGIASMHEARAHHTATRLPDGRVLVVGGNDIDGEALASVELFDPATQTWSSGPALKTPRTQHSAALLPDGRVLVVGGIGPGGLALASTEIYDPSGNWASSGTLALPLAHVDTLTMASGDVLAVGTGHDGDHTYQRVALWDKSSGQWRPAGTLRPSTRFQSSQTYQLLPLAGKDTEALLFDALTVMRWSPQDIGAGEWSAYGGRTGYAAATLANGKVMLAGGRMQRNHGAPGTIALDWAEIFDPTTTRFAITGRMTQARSEPFALALPDGRVLVASNPDDTDKKAAGQSLLHHFVEIWSPTEEKWRALPELDPGLFDFAQLLRMVKQEDGRVGLLYKAGDNKESGYQLVRWDPRTGQLTRTAVPIPMRFGEIAGLTTTGRVLIVGGGAERVALAWDGHRLVDLTPPPDWHDDNANVIATADGDIVLAGSVRDAGVHGAPVLRWVSASGTWRPLPALPPDGLEKYARVELADKGGMLYSPTFMLAPAATNWTRIPDTATLPDAFSWTRLLTQQAELPLQLGRDPDSGKARLLTHRFVRLHPGYRPAMAEMSDGRVMIAGAPDLPGKPTQTLIQIWNPKTASVDDTDLSASVYHGNLEAMRLPSGQMMLVGLSPDKTIVCEVGHPAEHRWDNCGPTTPTRQDDQAFTLRAGIDGRAVLSFSARSSYVYDERAGQWNARDGAGEGSEDFSWALPDGCVLRGLPFLIHNPRAGAPTQSIVNPVPGILTENARVIVLRDGTAIAVGYPQGGDHPGGGLFQRKASCSGFAHEDGDELAMGASGQESAPAPATTSQLMQPGAWRGPAARWALGAALALVLLWLLRRRIRPALDTLGDLGGRPAVRYGLLIVVIGAVGWTMRYRLMHKAGIQVGTTQSRLCAFAGEWSSSRGYLITLNADGSYQGAPLKYRGAAGEVFTGKWEVADDTVTWTHFISNAHVTETNAMRQDGPDDFMLTEEDGGTTAFKRVGRPPETQCVDGKPPSGA